MKRNLLTAAFVGTALSLCLYVVDAAQGQNRAAGAGVETRVALVDLAYVFKNYEKFKNLNEQLKADVQQRAKELDLMQEEIKSLAKQRASHNPGTPIYKDTEEKLVRKRAEWELAQENSRKEFTDREAAVYHQIYQEVEAAIKWYAEGNSITLVLRSTRPDEPSSANPQDVIKEVSQQVIWSVPQMDITDAILSILNRSQGNAAPKKSAGTPQKVSGAPGKAGSTRQ